MNLNVTINIWALVPVVLAAIIVAYAVWKQNQQKQSLLYLAALLICISLVVFLSTAAGIYWNNQEDSDFWNLATIVFTLFGALMTAGGAFATVVAIVSYFSINQKLKEAKDSLEKFEELDQKRKQLEQELETLKAYQSVVQDLQQYDTADIDEEVQQKSLQAARQILANPQAGFEARLKARAIIQDDKIYREFEQVRAEPSEEAWQQVTAMRQENLAVWKLLFQAAAEAGDAYEKAKSNYATALLNYGVALSFYGHYLRKQDEIDKAVRQWQQAGQQYARALEIKSDKHAAIHNWGNALANEAHAVAAGGDLKAARVLWEKAGEKYWQILDIKSDTHEAAFGWGWALAYEAQAVAASGDLEAARVLWTTAGEKYQLALDIKADKHQAAHNWFVTLVNEAAYLSDTDQIQLWQNAHAQVLKLQNHSPEHRQSEVIQNLLKNIDAEINKLSPQESTP